MFRLSQIKLKRGVKKMMENNKVKVAIEIKKTRTGQETEIKAEGYGSLDMLINGATSYIHSIINNAIREADINDDFTDDLKDFILADIYERVNDRF
jgi:hypothetical protein